MGNGDVLMGSFDRILSIVRIVWLGIHCKLFSELWVQLLPKDPISVKNWIEILYDIKIIDIQQHKIVDKPKGINKEVEFNISSAEIQRYNILGSRCNTTSPST